MFFLFQATRRRESFEGLSSSLVQSSAQLWLVKSLPWEGKLYFFWNFQFCQTLGFEPHLRRQTC